MKTENNNSANALIAEFLHGKDAVHPNQYHENWNELMQVVERIEETEIENNILMLESIGNMAKFIFDDGCRFLDDCVGETKIEAVYNAVIAFIEWYNISAKEN